MLLQIHFKMIQFYSPAVFWWIKLVWGFTGRQQMQVWGNRKELFNETRDNMPSIQSKSKSSFLIQADSAKSFRIHDPICCFSLWSLSLFNEQKDIWRHLLLKKGWISYFINITKISKARRLKIGISREQMRGKITICSFRKRGNVNSSAAEAYRGAGACACAGPEQRGLPASLSATDRLCAVGLPAA